MKRGIVWLNLMSSLNNVRKKPSLWSNNSLEYEFVKKTRKCRTFFFTYQFLAIANDQRLLSIGDFQKVTLWVSQVYLAKYTLLGTVAFAEK